MYHTRNVVSLLLLVLLSRLRSKALVRADNRTEESCQANVPTMHLHNGVEMPALLLGTAQLVVNPGTDSSVHDSFRGMVPERAYRQIELALQQGLRAFDSAYIYRTLPVIHHVFVERWRQGIAPYRNEVWITSKVHHPDATSHTFARNHMPDWHNMSPDEIGEATWNHVEASLHELGMGYVDLMLLHWPGYPNMGNSTINRQRRIKAWQALERMYNKGWARAIGVSNFSPQHIEQLQQDGATVKPMVNQFEASVNVQYTDILEYCLKHDIVPQAYSPMGRHLKEIPSLVDTLGKKYNKDIGQIIFRYLVQLGYSVVYLTNSKSRMISNNDIYDFEISSEDMTALHNLATDTGTWGLPRPTDIE